MVAASCHECVHYQRAYSTSGRGGQTERCDYENEDNVATFKSVTETSDCPYFSKPKINLVSDRYPQRKISESTTEDPTIDTLSDQKYDVDPFRDLPQRKRRSRY